jgi:hypothetical protein
MPPGKDASRLPAYRLLRASEDRIYRLVGGSLHSRSRSANYADNAASRRKRESRSPCTLPIRLKAAPCDVRVCLH